jgi:release factor glutamine methyltransferase
MSEAELLFTEVLNYSRSDLYLNRAFVLDKYTAARIASVLKRRIAGEPIQYIIGSTEFMGLRFGVIRGVFIPRPETEILVERVLGLAGSVRRIGSETIEILDIGTGSGCIAVAVAKLSPSVLAVTATDISLKAFILAAGNARLQGVDGRIRFVKSDLFASNKVCDRQYDIIVSNPPYVPTAEINRLQPEVRCEPWVALDGGEDGLAFYRRIIPKATDYLKRDGFLVMEIGYGQGGFVQRIIEGTQRLHLVEVVKDYSGIDRVIITKRNG